MGSCYVAGVWIWIATTFAGEAVLHVAVHQQAGTIYDIAADGADGQCRVLGLSRLACPASGPVHFRWGGPSTYALHGDRIVAPGETGTAFVLPPDGSRHSWRERLRDPTAEAVRATFVRTADRPVPIPSPALLSDLFALTAHPDPTVRREAVRGLLPYARHTASDPFPPDAPSVIPAELLERLSHDPDRRVRRHLGRLLRETSPYDPLAASSLALAERLGVDTDRRVRRLAQIATIEQVRAGTHDALEAWSEALTRVPEPGPVGRAACKALAALREHLPPTSVDPDRAVALAVMHHPEKAWQVWGAWRHEVPLHPGRLRYLLDTTVNLSLPLLRTFAEREPEVLAGVLSDWEPGLPHSPRFQAIANWLRHRTKNPVLLHVLTWNDTLSGPGGPTPAQ